MTTRVAVAVGSNLGDRQRYVLFAQQHLVSLLDNLHMSTVFETEPVGVGGVQPRFLNAAVVGDTALNIHEFFHALQDIERAAGRERPFPNAARTLDLDLVLFGTTILRE